MFAVDDKVLIKVLSKHFGIVVTVIVDKCILYTFSTLYLLM